MASPIPRDPPCIDRAHLRYLGAANTDPVLPNAWGVAFTPGASPFWIADNDTGCSTLYDGARVPQPLTPKPLQERRRPSGGVSQNFCGGTQINVLIETSLKTA